MITWFKNLWLGSKERKELQEKIKLLENRIFLKEIVENDKKLYKNRTKLGDITLCILEDGEVLSIEDKTDKIYNEIPLIRSLEYLKALFHPKNSVEENQDVIIEKNDLTIFTGNKDFDVNGNKVYLKDISWEIPKLIVAEFIEILEKIKGGNNIDYSYQINKRNVTEVEFYQDKYNRLYLFTLYLACAPLKNKEALLTYLKINDVHLSPRGNLVQYRRVVKWNKKDVREIDEEYIKTQWGRIKKNKKSPKKYEAWKNFNNTNEFKIIEIDYFNRHPIDKSWTYVGNLNDLYLKTQEEFVQLYTSWNNKGKYTFTIPGIYKVDDDEVNVDGTLCSHGSGLHSAHKDFSYSEYGDTPVVVLLNPVKSLLVPVDVSDKIRGSEMYIVGINPSEGKHISDDFITNADEYYSDLNLEELKSILKEKDFSPITAENGITEVSLQDISQITKLLENRVVQF